MSNNLKQYYAKSSGINFLDHSIFTKKISEYICDITLKHTPTDVKHTLELLITYGLMLHDIGKLITENQKYFIDKMNSIKNIKYPTYYHNEIGWAFLDLYLDFNKINLTDSIISVDEFKEILLDGIYYHHPIKPKNYNSNPTSNMILSDIDNPSIKIMSEFSKYVFKNNNIVINNINEFTLGSNRPNWFNNTNDKLSPYKLLVRGCIIGADRIVSKYENTDFDDSKIKELVYKSFNRVCLNKMDIQNSIYQNDKRFDEKINLLDSINKQTTTKFNAITGFGKTLMALLWMLRYGENKRLIWVCPRNSIAKGVYKTIIKELKELSLDNISIELFLNGETKENMNGVGDFESDIVVTNIDNYLNTSLKNNRLSQLYLTNDVNVVFDEYHEFVNNAPILSLFINIMRLRHNILKTNTLLLSATPIPIENFWENSLNKINILPKANEHFKCNSNSRFKFNVKKEFNDYTIDLTRNNLIMCNSITKIQELYTNNNFDVLYHSKFIEEELNNKFTDLLSEYGENSGNKLNRKNYITTNIIEAGINVSFLNLYISLSDFQSLLQAMGRINRFFEYKGIETPTINVFYDESKPEITVRKCKTSIDLSNYLYNYLKNFDGNKLTIDELYELYNKFYNDSNIKKKYFNYLMNSVNESKKNLSNLFPVKLNSNYEDDQLIAGGNKLRSISTEIFYICKIDGTDDYIKKPFQTKIYNSIREDFGEINMNKTNKLLKKLTTDPQYNYDYSKFLKKREKNRNQIALEKIARNSKTPYIRTDVIYNNVLGVVKIKNL